MAKDAQRSQSAVPRAMAAFGQALAAWGSIHVRGRLRTGGLQRRTAL